MKVKGTRKVKLTDLHHNLFVRKALDSDRAIYLGELIEAGVEMSDPIEVTELNGNRFEIVDGRHRREAYELAKIDEIKVRVLEFESDVEMISHAYKANTGGSKPPSIEDTEHTIMILLEKGESMKAIGEHLALPASIARKYANEVRSRMNRAKLQRAAEAVTDGGLNVKQASEQYDVDPEKLKEVLSGKTRKSKHGVEEIRRVLSKLYKSAGMRNAALIKKMMDKYEDGDVTEKQVRDLFAHMESLQKQSSRATSDWKQRFEAIIGVQTKSKETPAGYKGDTKQTRAYA